MIYDLIVIAVVFISLIIGYNRGAAKMLCSLLGSVVSVVVSAILSDFLSKYIYNSFIAPSIIDSVTNSLGVESVSKSEIFDSLPPFVRFTLGFTSFDEGQSAIGLITDNIALSVEKAVSQPVMSLLSVVLSLVLFFVVFFLFRFIFSRILCAVFELPVIRTFNKVLGAVCCVICSLVFVGFFAFLLNVLMPYLNDVPYIFSESTIYNSYIFYHFYSGNIFTKLISIF